MTDRDRVDELRFFRGIGLTTIAEIALLLFGWLVYLLIV